MQWNLMARCISIDPIALHNFSLGEDNIMAEHDSTKADKEGLKSVKKHIYANPTDPTICPNTAFGVWLALKVKLV